jgi:hypothetical protein
MFGRRTLKTVIAVMLSLFVAQLLGLEPPVFAAIAAALSVQPTSKRSYRYAVEQIQANIVGVIVSIVIVSFFGATLYSIALAIMIVIGLNLFFKWENSIPLSIVTVIFIMESPSDDFLIYALNRFAVTFLGILIASSINIVLLPPKYATHLRRQYVEALPIVVNYISTWQSSGVFQSSLRSKLKKIIEKTERFEQWMKEQSHSQAHAPAYFRGLKIESEKNEVLSEFLHLTELYSKIDQRVWPDLRLYDDLKKHLLILNEQVIAVLSNSPLPSFEQVDLSYWKQLYCQENHNFNTIEINEVLYIQMFSTVSTLLRRLKKYNRYRQRQDQIDLIKAENRWLFWKIR